MTNMRVAQHVEIMHRAIRGIRNGYERRLEALDDAAKLFSARLLTLNVPMIDHSLSIAKCLEDRGLNEYHWLAMSHIQQFLFERTAAVASSSESADEDWDAMRATDFFKLMLHRDDEWRTDGVSDAQFRAIIWCIAATPEAMWSMETMCAERTAWYTARGSHDHFECDEDCVLEVERCMLIEKHWQTLLRIIGDSEEVRRFMMTKNIATDLHVPVNNEDVHTH